MNAAHVWFISADRWSCPDCERTIHRRERESNEEWTKRLRGAQKLHGFKHSRLPEVPR